MAVRVLGAGGTIAARLAGDLVELASVAELCAGLPPGLPAVDAVDVERVPSSQLGPSEMLAIARRAVGALHDGSEGVVVTHGTDTLEDTLFLTDLLLGEASALGGVIFTGAMRFDTDPVRDGPRNLADAVRLACSPEARGLGAVLCFDGDVHAARWVTKADTRGARPFTSHPHEPVGHVTSEAITIGERPPRSWGAGEDADARVGLVRAYPGVSSVVLDALVGDGVRGVVIEGFGVMNVPATLFDAVARAVGAGVAVVIASRARTYGGLDQGPLGHRTLHDLGAVGSYGLPADKARIALMVGLARTDGTTDDIRGWMRSLQSAP